MWKKKMAADSLKNLLDLLDLLPTKLDVWQDDKFSNNEAVLERNFCDIDDHIDHISLIYNDICIMINGNEEIQTVINVLDELLIVLSDLRKIYDDRILNLNNGPSCSRPCLERRSSPGRPKILLDEQQIINLKELNMTWKAIASLLGIHEKTLQKKRKELNLDSQRYTILTDEELDNVVSELVKNNPNAGERMIQGGLVGLKHRVQRWRLRASLNRVDPDRKKRMNKRRIRRRCYTVPSPNALWHLDGNHKLIRWRFVIHGCIDGYSRCVVFLRCATNNLAETVLDNFNDAISKFRMPLRVRTDHGTENVLVARAMLEAHGISSKPVITGKSVHNQRIERLWVDVGTNVISHLRNLFYQLEECFDLDPDNDLHLFALHYVYLPRINKMLDTFTSSWNNHPIRTAKNHTPLQLWTEGFVTAENDRQNLLQSTDIEEYDGIDWYGPIPELQTVNHVEVPDVEFEITNEQLQTITENFDPLKNDFNYGINTYCQLVNYINLL